MTILPLHSALVEYLQKRRLGNKFEKQKQFFEANPFHPSLETELLQPQHYESGVLELTANTERFLFFEKKI